MMRKRTYGTRARSQSRSAKRSKKTPLFVLGKPNNGMRSRWTKAKLTYCDTYALDPGLSTAAVQVFTANGLYDPDITGIGHQPAGYDQYMALYDEYLVTKSWIKVSFYNTDTTNTQVVGLGFLDFATTSADFRKYVEQGNFKWASIDTSKSGQAFCTITHELDMRKCSTQDIFNEDNFTGKAGSNPSDTHYWHVVAAAGDLSTNSSPVRCIVEIQYEVYFRDPAFTDLS